MRPLMRTSMSSWTITSGPWEVQGTNGGPFQGPFLHHVDEKNGWVYVTASRDSPIATNLYRVRLDGSGTVERLTREPGEHAVSVNPTGTLFIDTYSDSATPTRPARAPSEEITSSQECCASARSVIDCILRAT